MYPVLSAVKRRHPQGDGAAAAALLSDRSVSLVP
jgi:hypothetical protein